MKDIGRIFIAFATGKFANFKCTSWDWNNKSECLIDIRFNIKFAWTPGSPNDNRAKKFDFKPCRWTFNL
jgi:hypothetical protein